ncbi:maleylpyruvate isomerase N-terminal domain-containing protein [Actinoplanes sp. NPDC023714]|uniref:maleylpyruvate isomerase N-terminal domain-containing protein n=1 Tax=Actinoplanes sp. NPDC023714 TaxID=3154322 RepID=UPI0033E53661
MDVWDEITALRLAIAGLLDDLTAEEWAKPSLCAGWTVRDVAAHLTLQQLGLRDLWAAAAATQRRLTMRMPPPLPPARAMRGLRLVATDVDRRHGEGPGIRGPIGAPLLACCGRAVWLSQLSGDGVEVFRQRAAL